MAGKLTECECYKLLMAYVDELKAVKEYRDLAGKIMGRAPEIEELSDMLSKRIAVDEGVHADTLTKAIEKHCGEHLKGVSWTAKKCEE